MIQSNPKFSYHFQTFGLWNSFLLVLLLFELGFYSKLVVSWSHLLAMQAVSSKDTNKCTNFMSFSIIETCAHGVVHVILQCIPNTRQPRTQDKRMEECAQVKQNRLQASGMKRVVNSFLSSKCN